MLIFSTYFQSPLGLIHLNSDGKFLTGAYFQDHENLKNQSTTVFKEDLKIFQEAKTFLIDYFQKRNRNAGRALCGTHQAQLQRNAGDGFQGHQGTQAL